MFFRLLSTKRIVSRMHAPAVRARLVNYSGTRGRRAASSVLPRASYVSRRPPSWCCPTSIFLMTRLSLSRVALCLALAREAKSKATRVAPMVTKACCVARARRRSGDRGTAANHARENSITLGPCCFCCFSFRQAELAWPLETLQ